jgi:ribosomal protein S18 acetylase RimI-like enzyme
MLIREATKEDLFSLLNLYTHLHDSPIPENDDSLTSLWTEILHDPHHHIIVGQLDGQIICSCVLLIVPNLTHKQRPYAVIENVITHKNYRSKGYATQILDYTKKIAESKNCYKIMLMTGSKENTTLRFYEHAGFNRQDKTAFIMWLDP